jgi:hypothetical protein
MKPITIEKEGLSMWTASESCNVTVREGIVYVKRISHPHKEEQDGIGPGQETKMEKGDSIICVEKYVFEVHVTKQ